MIKKTKTFQSNGLQDEKNELLITPHLRDEFLPTLLREALSVAPEGEMRDMLLLSLLTNCAYALPAMRMYHGYPRHTYGPDLLTMVLAPAASGKGIMNYGKMLMYDIEYAYGAPVYLPANTSASALMHFLQLFRGKGIIMATEIDTLSQAIRSAFGGFSDMIRCFFEHESISQMRRQDEEFIEIDDPHVSMLLSGTHNQLSPLLRSRENGLMSRFICYVVHSRMDFDDRVWDADEAEGTPKEVLLYKRLSRELCMRYAWMQNAKHDCYFYFTDAQRKTIKRMFRSEFNVYSQELGEFFDATLKRMPVIMKRIGMILTGLRMDITKPLAERVVCSEEDFQTILLIGHKLLIHAALVHQKLPNVKETPTGEIGQHILQKQFFEMLPADFSKQDAVKQAEVLGINIRTMEDWLEKFIQCSEIERVMKGKYHKKKTVA